MKRLCATVWPWATMVLLACVTGVVLADDVVVGGSNGWKLGVTYDDLTVKPGDTLVFNYNPSAHNVYSLASGECDFSNGATELSSDSSPTRVTLDKPGTYWYGCSIPGHCDGGMLQKVVVEAGYDGDDESDAYAYYTNLTTWFNYNPRYAYLYDYIYTNYPEVLSGETPLTIFIPIGSNKTWENAGWPQPLPTAFYPRLVVPTAYKSYEDLVAAGTVTTYDNTTINFSYNEDDEVLGEWQDRTQAKAYVEDAAYPYGKSVIYPIRPYSWAPRGSPSPAASPPYTTRRRQM